MDESVEDERRASCSRSVARELNRDELIIRDKFNPLAESRSLSFCVKIVDRKNIPTF